MPDMLPVLDEEPTTWGPDHDDLIGDIAPALREELIEKGNRQGRFIDPDDDFDNGSGIELPPFSP